MSPHNIVIGQKVTDEKAQRARELRQEMTKAEAVLWQELRTNRLDGWHFRRQQVIRGYIADFYCHQAALVIEIDGPVHEHLAEADHERERVFEEQGLCILRFTNQQILEQLSAVLNAIWCALQVSRKET